MKIQFFCVVENALDANGFKLASEVVPMLDASPKHRQMKEIGRVRNFILIFTKQLYSSSSGTILYHT